jgi:hypothetical protein
MAAALLCGSPARAQQPQAITSIKGTYNGSFTSTVGGESGTFSVKITKDKVVGASHVVKAVVKLGKKSHKMQGAFDPLTRQINLGGLTGRPPKHTMTSLIAFFNEEGTALEGLFTATPWNGTHNQGEFTASKPVR